jgi:hypothetical protein
MFGPPDTTNRMLGGVVRAAVDVRHHRYPGLEAGQAKRQLGKDQQRDADDHQRTAVLLGQGGGPVRPQRGVCYHLSDAVGDDDDVQDKVDRHQDDSEADGLLEPTKKDSAE